MNNNTIQIFEYEYLFIGQHGFKKSHYEALARYNDAHGGKFFKLHLHAVRFLNFVGVIQAGDLTIEILPKIGKQEGQDDKNAWQKVLLGMLQECNWMKVHAHEKASLQYKFNNILEAYLDLFLRECEYLLNQGLIKKYRLNDANLLAFKGKVLFAQNIQKNNVHQERFFSRHQIYTQNNLINQILLKAIRLIPYISNSPLLKDRVYRLIFAFPELDDIQVNQATFESITYDRKISDYKEAIEIAGMILLNFRPDISAGRNHVLAILFDMNILWEEYVYRQLIKHNHFRWSIVPQQYKTIWKKDDLRVSKGVKPDIVLGINGKSVIIDTKWKLPEDNVPADSDLKQMFVYNEYWSGAAAILLYPKPTSPDPNKEVTFESGGFVNYPKKEPDVYKHTCGIMKANILDVNKNLCNQIGSRIMNRVNELITSNNQT